ncbi:MAG: peptidoglycan-binding protein [Patescibacteria group bacterium]
MQNISAVFETDLSPGMQNDDVKRLQLLLATNKEIYPEGLVTGFYGDKTVEAVKRFQLKYGVIKTVTDTGAGLLGPKTRAKIKEIFSIVSITTSEKALNCVWRTPVSKEYFTLSQGYLNEDWEIYKRFGHHPGVDYGGRRKTGIPLFACADGEIIYREVATSVWGASLGNHLALYVPAVDKTFLYCHLEKEPCQLGPIKAGDQIGIMGNTGISAGKAIHLHLEGFHGRFVIAWRTFLSIDDIKTKTFDADKFIRSYLVNT